jgi:hypothetical protein
MKARSLYHLLITRLRQLTGGAVDEDSFAHHLKTSLAIEQTGAWFTLKWRSRNKQYDLNVPSSTFEFYRRGDLLAAPTGEPGRVTNWRAAETLLRHMATVSEETLPADPHPGSLSPLRFSGAVADQTVWLALLVPVLPAAAIALREDGLSALAVYVAGAALCAAFMFQRDTLLRRPMSPVEALVIAAGPALAASLGVTPWGMALLAGGLAMLSWSETPTAPAAPVGALAGGALVGGVAALIGPAGWLTVAFVAAMAVFLHALMPWRIRRSFTIAAALGAGTVALAAHLAGAAGPAGTPAGIAIGLVLGVTGAAALCFLTWWIIGSQIRLFPWVSLGAVAALGITTFWAPSAGGETLACAGYVACAAVRLVHAFITAEGRAGALT